jgi:hypothetical protein
MRSVNAHVFRPALAAFGVAVAAILLASPARAEAPSAFATPLPIAALEDERVLLAGGSDVADAIQAFGVGFDVATSVVAMVRGGSPTRYDAVRYRPRRGRDYDSRSSRSYGRGVSQLHVGFLDPDGAPERGVLFGFRGGQQIDDHVQVGLGVDWRHTSENTSSVIEEGVGPGGTTIITQRDLERSSSNHFPLMAYLQVSGGSELPVVPYFGVGGGYQLLFLSAENFQTGEEFEGTFGGWGWQLWGGAAVPMSSRSRIFGEVFINDAEVKRDVEDVLTGQTLRQSVDMDGVGGRIGLSWGF